MQGDFAVLVDKVHQHVETGREVLSLKSSWTLTFQVHYGSRNANHSREILLLPENYCITVGTNVDEVRQHVETG